ncbi:Alpha/beta hydrolase fold-1 [Dactylonectria macrodidyma]|uniref:Alpha/beta hydrolase fold-1 n=1 Tax=Dactylonectria macrodidyma TaxID=307937 RepID=A0A9P9DRS8_9HYPO|nr:Alpha/beta hydrolase fold-1 [Dactylonectria macrodidyma]
MGVSGVDDGFPSAQIGTSSERRGWETDAVTYPSVGAEPPTKGIPDDAAALRNVLEALADQGKQIVLVVHSYGGLVGANAVRGLGYEQRQKEGKAGGIITFLYLTAFVTPGSYVFADTPEEILYHDVPSDLQKEAVAAVKHECVRAWTDEVDYQPWHDIHCLYFVCEEDRAVPVAVQEQMAQILGPDSIIFWSRSSHSPFLSAVQDVVDGVEKAAESDQMRVEL